MKQTEELPEEMSEDKKQVKRIHGDGLCIRLDTNKRVLEVTGDGSRITVMKNLGIVHVLGDGCKLKVVYNMGEVHYQGDGGHVILGSRSSAEKVQYSGDGGKVTFDLDATEATLKAQKNVSSNSKYEAEISRGRGTKGMVEVAAKTSGGFRKKSLKNRGKDSSNIAAEIENILNVQKKVRANEGKRDVGKEEIRKKADKTVMVKTKIVKIVKNDSGEFTRQWLVSSGKVFDSYDGCLVKILSKRTKIVTDAE